MATCIPLVEEKIRAEFWMGTSLIAKTPYIVSFNVEKNRKSITDTFTIIIEILANVAFPLRENVSIKAGTRGNLREIFTGKIEQTRAEPAFGKPSYKRMSISGRGVLSELEGKRFSRRLRTDGQGMFCLITQGPNNRPDAWYSLDGTKNVGERQMILQSPSPTKMMPGENSPLIIKDATQGQSAAGGEIGAMATEIKSGGKPNNNDGLTIHTHESLDQGGPAYGVYSAE